MVMTRLMGDAIHDNVAALAAVPGLQLVAGYVTGSPDIIWTAADWDLFPSLPHVTIDQGYTGSPVASAIVRDVETGAWTPANAVATSPWTPARPTIYCNQSTLPAVLAAGWQGDLWLAIVGWATGDALPAAPGCTIVAVQNELDVGNAYDLSTVIDPYWPLEAPVTYPVFVPGYRTCYKCSATFLQIAPAGWGNVCPAGGSHSSGVAGTADTLTMVQDGITQAGS
jgi:hypothetical protein